MIHRNLLACAAAAILMAPAWAETAPNCTLAIVSSLDLQATDSGLLTVPASFNDQTFRILVDTGDYYSVVTTRTAKVLGINPEPTANLTLMEWGGHLIDRFINVEKFGFGRMKRGRTQFMVMRAAGREFDGLLGADFLYYFDLDFDFIHAKLNLISPDRCKGKAVYWTKGDYGVIPFDYKERQIRFTVMLDGKEVLAMLDTGASDTVMSLEKATGMFSWDDKTVATASDRFAFKTLSIGGVTVNNPVINLVPDKRSVLMGEGGPRLILGMSVLRRLHLFISYKEEMIYVTPVEQN